MSKKYYVASYLWVSLSEKKASIGLTKPLHDELGDLTFLSLPTVGSVISLGDSIIDVEAEKAVTELYSPVNGKVVAVNENLLESLDELNKNPEETWLIQIEEMTDHESWLTPEEFKTYCKTTS